MNIKSAYYEEKYLFNLLLSSTNFIQTGFLSEGIQAVPTDNNGF